MLCVGVDSCILHSKVVLKFWKRAHTLRNIIHRHSTRGAFKYSIIHVHSDTALWYTRTQHNIYGHVHSEISYMRFAVLFLHIPCTFSGLLHCAQDEMSTLRQSWEEVGEARRHGSGFDGPWRNLWQWCHYRKIARAVTRRFQKTRNTAAMMGGLSEETEERTEEQVERKGHLQREVEENKDSSRTHVIRDQPHTYIKETRRQHLKNCSQFFLSHNIPSSKLLIPLSPF